MNVTLPAGVAVDLYAATGITVGKQIQASVVSGSDVRLSNSAAGLLNNYTLLSSFNPQARNDAGDTGAWAKSMAGGGVNIKEVI